MEKPRIDKKDLEIVKKQLAHGDLVTIAEMTGKSRSLVQKVFTGDVSNFRVFEAAISLLEKRRKTLESIRKKQE
ncbi:MAG: hypothetical protein ACOZCO_15340 [Bacteroidota bacterium]